MTGWNYAMTSPGDVKNLADLSYIPFILLQIIAFICWNSHYKWFGVSVTSCWKGDKQDG